MTGKANKPVIIKSSANILSTFTIELTERCNNNCVHCYINQPADDQAVISHEMPTDEVKKHLEEAVSLGALQVKFTGGEPLLRDDFEELYIFARKLGLKVFIFTNATLITPHLADLFARIRPFGKIEVTVYGMHERSYQSVSRKRDSFEAAWRGINLLLERNIPFIVKGVILPANKEDIDDFEEWAASIPWMGKKPQLSMFLDLRGRRDSEERNNLIKKLRLSSEEGLKYTTRDPENFIAGVKGFFSRSTINPNDNLFNCSGGFRSGCIDSYSKFQICLLLRHPDTVYDLKSGSLEDALENFFPRVRQMKATNPEYLKRCARCFLSAYCEQCPAKSWIEHGTLDTPVEYVCDNTHAQAEYLGLLSKGEKSWEVDDWEDRIKKFVDE